MIGSNKSAIVSLTNLTLAARLQGIIPEIADGRDFGVFTEIGGQLTLVASEHPDEARTPAIYLKLFERDDVFIIDAEHLDADGLRLVKSALEHRANVRVVVDEKHQKANAIMALGNLSQEAGVVTMDELIGFLR